MHSGSVLRSMGEGASKPNDSRLGPGIAGRAHRCREEIAGDSRDTVIIFDWDDTLLCSSAINQQQWNAEQLESLELAGEAALEIAMSLGDTLIVTNGNQTWVQDSSRRFLPKLQPVLSQLRVMSARAIHEQNFPGQPFAWKKAAFKEILSERYAGVPETSATGLNLIVIGDSLAEIEAARVATMNLQGPPLLKTIKFKEMPSAWELVGELRLLAELLPEWVNQDISSSQALIPRQLPLHQCHMTSWASGWQVVDHRLGYFGNHLHSFLEPDDHFQKEQPAVTLAGG